jgi:glycine/D-amino acid oxidase-like deaminating enzyme
LSFRFFLGPGLADIIVIGGGIAGCATAYYLAADGVDVTLLEQYELNTLASGVNAGSLHAQIQTHPFVELGESWAREYSPTVPFYVESIALWQEAGTVLGADLEVTQGGGLLVAANDSEMRLIEAKMNLERAAGLETALLDSNDLRNMAPYISENMVGAAFYPVEGKANPLVAAPAFAAAAESLGAKILQGYEVVEIQCHKTGYQVETSKGGFQAPRLVNAAGISAGRVAAMVGAEIEVQSFPIQLTVTEPMAPLIRHLVYSAGQMLTLKQTKSGTVLIGGGWPAMLDKHGRTRVLRESLFGNLGVAVEVVPDLASSNIVRTWVGQVNGNESWRPVIGEVPGLPGFFINYVPWMGFTGGPAAGRIIASQAQGREPPVGFDVSCFRP